MPPFFLALIAAAAATFGGREAVRVARLSAGLGRAAPLLAASWLACIVAFALAARLGAAIGGQMAGEAKAMLVAFALAAGAAELAILRPAKAPAEPTRSFGAIALVLGAGQLTAAAGLLVFALAAASGTPWLAAVGGAFGAGAVLTGAWLAGGEWEKRLPLKAIRLSVAAALFVAGIWIGLSARGLLG